MEIKGTGENAELHQGATQTEQFLLQRDWFLPEQEHLDTHLVTQNPILAIFIHKYFVMVTTTKT